MAHRYVWQIYIAVVLLILYKTFRAVADANIVKR